MDAELRVPDYGFWIMFTTAYALPLTFIAVVLTLIFKEKYKYSNEKAIKFLINSFLRGIISFIILSQILTNRYILLTLALPLLFVIIYPIWNIKNENRKALNDFNIKS